VLKRVVTRVPVGEATEATVVTDQLVGAAKAVEPVAPDRAFPIVLQMCKPVGRLDDRRTPAVAGPGEPDAVRRCAIANLVADAAILRRRAAAPLGK